ncbi:MAG: DUF998 domain-containing protein [Defluviitaleaceae bacterium]|nr:DUF998 domain-containing protein [Defluviitaleaceae bacterium]MCL2274678.1 DUF998 domain-containing protein [Defluviitaleaceae bacterium]MCL2275761.1 DUF998 domain-containing protein [Defluviitaleaceae bacterium]
MKNKSFIQWCGLLGFVSFFSYALAVVFAPRAYPNYLWMQRAVSDLSAADAPSFVLWTRLAGLYGITGITCLMMACVAIRGKLNKPLRLGIYLFTAMFWVSVAGYAAFPLSQSGGQGNTPQDIMHLVVTGIVVVLSIVSLVLIMVGSFRKKYKASLGVCAAVALFLMCVGAVGTGVAPDELFGVFQRFSNLIAVNGFLVVLGMYLFFGKLEGEVC